MADKSGTAGQPSRRHDEDDLQRRRQQQQQLQKQRFDALSGPSRDIIATVPREYLEDPDVEAPAFLMLKEREEFLKFLEAADSTTEDEDAGAAMRVETVGGSSGSSFDGRYEDYISSRERDKSDQGRTATMETKKTEASEKTDKARARRAQVRRAQIRHRQRKADYVKELELNVSQLRDMVAAVEAETADMRKRNGEMKGRLTAAGVVLPGPAASRPQVGGFAPEAASLSSQTPLTRRQDLLDLDLDVLDPCGTSTDLFADTKWEEMAVSLSMNSSFGTPCFSVSPGSYPSSEITTQGSSKSPSPPAKGWQGMTLEEEAKAINFMLALEHCCWDHFVLGDFHSHHEHHIDSAGGAAHGHHLMATAYLMADAPDSFYARRHAFQHASLQPSTSFQWTTPSLSLDSFHGLALSLVNQQDMTELTPVQVWFELAARYPLDVLFADGVLEALAVELGPNIRCVLFGAVISRLCFEEIVGRILGPSPNSQIEAMDLQQWMYAPQIEGLV